MNYQTDGPTNQHPRQQSNYPMVTISTPPAPPPLIGRIFHQPPEPPMSSRSLIHTPSSLSVSSATMTALPRLTKNQSRSTNTTPQSSKATAYQMVSGASPSIPTNHRPTPCSPNKHNETSSNGSTPPPSVQVSALSSRPPNAIFSPPGPILHPKSFAATYNRPLPLPKAISTNNDNVAANHSMKRHHQLPSPHALTPFMRRFSIPNNQPATPSVISLADSQFSRIAGPTTYSCSMTTTAMLLLMTKDSGKTGAS